MLLYIPRALEETVRQWLHAGRQLYQQLETLNQQQLDQLLQHKQQLLGPRRRPSPNPLEGAP